MANAPQQGPADTEEAKRARLPTVLHHYAQAIRRLNEGGQWPVDSGFAGILERAVVALRAEEKTPHPDTVRLDFIEKMGRNSNWVARHSTTGRGYRLHNSEDGIALSARAAIDEAMRSSGPERP